jgi:hypothetical protein
MYHPDITNAAISRLEETYKLSLEPFSSEKVQEFESRMRDIEWHKVTGEPSRPLAAEEQHYVAVNRLLAKVDFRYFLTRFCKVLTTKKLLRPIVPWPSQEKVLKVMADEEKKQEGRLWCKIPMILLKSRQVGGTVIGEALIAHYVFLNPNTQGIIASDDPDKSLNLYYVLTRMYDNLPGWLRPTTVGGRVKGTHLNFPQLDSNVLVGSGNQQTPLGHGLTIDVAHFTELSTWEYPERIDEDLMPAFMSSEKHHSVLLFESTGAGGAGNWYHDHFMAAWKGQTSFKAIFAAWYLRPSNQLDPEGFTFKESTLNMASRVLKEQGEELSRGQLAYYQVMRQNYEAKGDLSTFYQEYPSTIMESFQLGVKSVWPIEVRSSLRDRVKEPLAVFEVLGEKRKLRKINLESWKEVEDASKWENRLVVWELPKRRASYVAGVDVAYGLQKEKHDSSSIQVLKIGTKEWPDEQVAEWHGSLTPDKLAGVAYVIGKLYRDRELDLDCLMAVENNPGSPGGTTQIMLQQLGYNNFYIFKEATKTDGGWTNKYGWWTTNRTRPLITTMLRDYLNNDDLVVNSAPFIEEMGTFIVNRSEAGNVKMEAAPNYHDDRIMSMAIALYVGHELDTLSLADERRRLSARRLDTAVRGKPKQLWELMATARPGQTMSELLELD